MSTSNQDLIDALVIAYAMELEATTNYIAASVNLNSTRADAIKKVLTQGAKEELLHAQTLADCIKAIDGIVPKSLASKRYQSSLQSPADSTDIVTIVEGIINAKDRAIAQYNKIIKLCEGYDYLTQDIAITILADEQQQRRHFVRFLKEYNKSNSF